MVGSGPNGSAAVTTIQSHGWLLVCDAQAVEIVAHSANLDALWPGTRFIGAALRDLLGSETSHAVRNALARASASPRPALVPRQSLPGQDGRFDFTVHIAGEWAIIEFEPMGALDFGALDSARALIDRLTLTKGLDKLALMATRVVFSVLAWDCATLMRLSPDGPAQVLAQQKRPDWPDSAQQALVANFSTREAAFYGKGLRFLADAGVAPAPLIGAVDVDLAQAILRPASADESARAQQAGSAALLALPIQVDGELWGLLLAHDRTPRALTQDERAMLEIFADFLSLSIESALWRQAAESPGP